MVLLRSISIFLTLATAGVAGLVSKEAPELDLVERHDGLPRQDALETILYKRDDVLTPRDLELADKHGVDVEQMWKHSVVKRADGDDYTIWVHNSFIESSDIANITDHESKRKRGLMTTGNFHPYLKLPHCNIGGHTSYNDDTGPNAPFTGGVQEMRDWAGRAEGYWKFNYPNHDNGIWLSLVIAGSNSGANAIFQVSPAQYWRGRDIETTLSAADLNKFVDEAHRRYARHVGGAWRVRAWGYTFCSIAWEFSESQRTYWRLTNTNKNVERPKGS